MTRPVAREAAEPLRPGAVRSGRQVISGQGSDGSEKLQLPEARGVANRRPVAGASWEL